MIGGNGSHWANCEEAHHDCALLKLREAEAEVERLNEVLRLAAADYWREQMDGLDSDMPVAHIIDATIAKWMERILARHDAGGGG